MISKFWSKHSKSTTDKSWLSRYVWNDKLHKIKESWLTFIANSYRVLKYTAEMQAQASCIISAHKHGQSLSKTTILNVVNMYK